MASHFKQVIQWHRRTDAHCFMKIYFDNMSNYQYSIDKNMKNYPTNYG